MGKGWLGSAISLSEHNLIYSEKAEVIPSVKDYLSSVSCKSKSFLKCDNEQKNKNENMFCGHLLESPQCGTTIVFIKFFSKIKKNISKSSSHTKFPYHLLCKTFNPTALRMVKTS